MQPAPLACVCRILDRLQRRFAPLALAGGQLGLQGWEVYGRCMRGVWSIVRTPAPSAYLAPSMPVQIQKPGRQHEAKCTICGRRINT